MVQYRVFTDMGQCNESDVTRLLALVPPLRSAYAMRYKHLLGQWTALKAWEMVNELSGWDGEWEVDDRGKPYIADGPYFSISHCKQGVAAAVDGRPIGIDIESIRRVDEALIAHTMNAEERAYIHGSKDVAVAFTQLWTRKEAVLKCWGTGIVDDLRGVLTRPEIARYEIETMVKTDYIVSICTSR